MPDAGQGRWQEAVPLLSQSQEALREAFGTEYEALGEAEFYLALAQVAAAAEVTLADLNDDLVKVTMFISTPHHWTFNNMCNRRSIL